MKWKKLACIGITLGGLAAAYAVGSHNPKQPEQPTAQVQVQQAEKPSETEKELENIVESAKEEIAQQPAEPNTPSKEDLEAQVKLFNDYMLEVNNYKKKWNFREFKSDSKHKVIAGRMLIYKASRKIIPEGSWFEKSLKIKEKQLEFLGRKGGENYTRNFEALELSYKQLSEYEDRKEESLTQMQENFNTGLVQDSNNPFTVKQEYLQNCLTTVRNIKQAKILKTRIDEIDREKMTETELKSFQEEVKYLVN